GCRGGRPGWNPTDIDGKSARRGIPLRPAYSAPPRYCFKFEANADHSNFLKICRLFASNLGKKQRAARTGVSSLAAKVCPNAACNKPRGQSRGRGHALSLADGILAHRRTGVAAERRLAAQAERQRERARRDIGGENPPHRHSPVLATAAPRPFASVPSAGSG